MLAMPGLLRPWMPFLLQGLTRCRSAALVLRDLPWDIGRPGVFRSVLLHLVVASLRADTPMSEGALPGVGAPALSTLFLDRSMLVRFGSPIPGGVFLGGAPALSTLFLGRRVLVCFSPPMTDALMRLDENWARLGMVFADHRMMLAGGFVSWMSPRLVSGPGDDRFLEAATIGKPGVESSLGRSAHASTHPLDPGGAGNVETLKQRVERGEALEIVTLQGELAQSAQPGQPVAILPLCVLGAAHEILLRRDQLQLSNRMWRRGVHGPGPITARQCDDNEDAVTNEVHGGTPPKGKGALYRRSADGRIMP